ncbi:MAG TPA: tetratricopeptide repeat protein [Bryobacteraceae bacterium]|nr:tetratricopeptide repeat protein [Bryobacteraceae bacterium]
MGFGSWLVSVTIATAAVFPAAFAQSTPSPNGFLNEAKADQPVKEPPKPVKVLSPEMRGDIFMARKMFREAAEAYQDGPKTAILLNKTGIAYHQMLEMGLAERFYKRAIKADPNYSEAINNLGTVYYAHKSYRHAINEYKKALHLAPEAASIWSNLGTGYFARHDYKRAAESFQKALALNPDVFELHSTQGVLLQERSVEERAKYHFYLAETYAKAGINDRAIQYIRKALEEGYKEKKKFEEDPAFAALRNLPEFKELMALEPRVL